jgi:hypothetical protein
MIVHNDPGRLENVVESDSKSLSDSEAIKFELATFEHFSSDRNRVSTMVLILAISALKNALKQSRKRRASCLVVSPRFPQLPTSGARCHVGGLRSLWGFYHNIQHIFSIEKYSKMLCRRWGGF